MQVAYWIWKKKLTTEVIKFQDLIKTLLNNYIMI